MSTIITRAGKGSALTHNEADANFTNLNTDKLEAAAITNMLETTDIGVSVQAYDADTTKNDVANTFTARQVISCGQPQLQLRNNVTDSTDQYSIITMRQYANSTEPEGFTCIGAAGKNGVNHVHIGGYFGEANAATSIHFHTAANNTTRSGTERMLIDSSGNVLVTSAAGLGYGTGAGGTVTQATSKSTAVTLNKPCGRIAMHNEALANGATVTFIVNNSLMTTNTLVLLNTMAISLKYRSELTYSGDGRFDIAVTNISGGSLSEAVDLKFALIKGVSE